MELVAVGVSGRDAAAWTGLSRATQDRHARRAQTGQNGQNGDQTVENSEDHGVPGEPGGDLDASGGSVRSPVNKLSELEEQEVLAVLNSKRFVDKAPKQVYGTLLAEGVYACSISTMYRLLGKNSQVKDRRRQATHPARAVPELQATGPGQVYSWDITKLPGLERGQWYDCYVMIDIYSRYVVGAHVHHTETAELAVDLMSEVFGVQGVPQVVHADRGTSMTSKSVAALLDDLQVTRSHSRPRVSNDNPYSEAWNKTLKYAPPFPERFTSLAAARVFIAEFVDYYNHSHRHSGIWTAGSLSDFLPQVGFGF